MGWTSIAACALLFAGLAYAQDQDYCPPCETVVPGRACDHRKPFLTCGTSSYCYLRGAAGAETHYCCAPRGNAGMYGMRERCSEYEGVPPTVKPDPYWQTEQPYTGPTAPAQPQRPRQPQQPQYPYYPSAGGSYPGSLPRRPALQRIVSKPRPTVYLPPVTSTLPPPPPPTVRTTTAVRTTRPTYRPQTPYQQVIYVKPTPQATAAPTQPPLPFQPVDGPVFFVTRDGRPLYTDSEGRPLIVYPDGRKVAIRSNRLLFKKLAARGA